MYFIGYIYKILVWNVGLQLFFIQLASDKLLQMVGDLFGIQLYINSVILREYCEIINIHLKLLVLRN